MLLKRFPAVNMADLSCKWPITQLRERPLRGRQGHSCGLWIAVLQGTGECSSSYACRAREMEQGRSAYNWGRGTGLEGKRHKGANSRVPPPRPACPQQPEEVSNHIEASAQQAIRKIELAPHRHKPTLPRVRVSTDEATLKPKQPSPQDQTFNTLTLRQH